eukprot:TRINITY_DN25320_c0_g1_i1.p1 TRINITY_DN25320_c0_g1~~TRINITY_DN25320_c0_g1_i1.p1  ORF type:complete len:180 (+),score=85.02 TRINITY_DN25320_c0_g1_i1:180-719(+)
MCIRDRQQQQPQQHQQSRPSYNTGEPDVLRNLIVNYIPTTIDENQLRQLFEMYGPTESVRIIINRETRQSRGFGFVKYAYAMSAVQALQCLNGYPLMNKRLKVAYAKEAEAQQANQEMSSNPIYAQSMMMMYQQQMQQQMMAQQLSLIHISEPTRLLSISYAVFCLKKKKKPLQLPTLN